MASDVCFICEESLEEQEISTVKRKGIETLISASKERKDRKNEKYVLKDKESIVVHAKCYKSYTHASSIRAYLRRSEEPIASSSTTRSQKFDFESLCLFCGSDATESFIMKEMRKRLSSPRPVRLLTTQATLVNIKNTAAARSDAWGDEVLNRVAYMNDLESSKARYHVACYPRFFDLKSKPDISKSSTPHIIDVIQQYIEDNPNEQQFSLSKMIDHAQGRSVNNQWLKKKLYEKLGEDIVITSNPGSEPIIQLRNTSHKILLKHFQDSQDTAEGRLKIVKTAAKIIKDDIRSMECDTTSYPPPESFFENVATIIPKSLKVFLDNVITADKNEEGNYLSKIVAIAHTIISCVRPRSFLSCLKIGLGAVLNRKFGSKTLLNILSSLGFSCSYKEALLFEASVISQPNNSTINAESFSQFAFDNADHNINTIDGLNTFHAMGGIECVTPKSAVSCGDRITKVMTIPSENTLASFGKLHLKAFHGYKKAGLGNVPVENLNEKNPNVRYDFDISFTDLMWIFNHKMGYVEKEGWNGFMEKITTNEPYAQSRIVYLPFLNHPPSDYDTIYTVLSLAIERISNKKQKTAFVTFDQPLYWKAKEIVHSTDNPEFKNLVIRLGGFHLAMSFLGSIGTIMDGSGLKELISQIYAPASVDKMLGGHAYSRAVRAHTLVHCTFVQVILSLTNFTDEDTSKIQTLLQNPETVLENLEGNIALDNIKSQFIKTVKRLSEQSETAKLWIQYLHMVSLLKMFIQAEKSGNWQLHLQTVQKMLPFFHSSGHFLYAKSAHLYLQDMYDLEERMDKDEFAEFTKGGFTIRRTDKFWSGIWSDMTIEQALMRTMKDIGGPTRGRGMSDSVLAKWVLTTPALVELTDSLTDFCNVYLATTEQHVDSRATRIARDIADMKKLKSWFENHNPFPDTDGIISLSTGLKGAKSDNINCHEALEVGLRCLTEMWKENDNGTLKTFNDVKYKRKNKITSLKALTSTIKISDRTVTIDPLLLFQRITVLKKTDEELKEYFNFELAPYPLSLFDEKGMRKTPKAKLYDFFKPVEWPVKGSDMYVVDGGFLLHKVVWRQNDKFVDIIKSYVNYLKNHYSANCIIVFDGYPDNGEEKYTKSAERHRRSRLNCAPEVVCDINLVSKLPQEKFLSNEKNKRNLIQMLSPKLQDEGFGVEQAVEDADCLIIKTAISVSDSYESVYVVGEDVDLLVILSQVAQAKKNIYLLKPSRQSIEEKLYSTSSFQYPGIQYLIGFIHAFTGCDTTSSLYKQGKAKLIKLLKSDRKSLQKEAALFNDPTSLKSSIQAAGQNIVMAMYGARNGDNISYDEFRYLSFTKSSLKKTFNLSCLPPTAEACNEHSLRTFLQVCQWQGECSKNPMQWGWKKSRHMLEPITCRKDPIPPNLLEIISCGCDKSGCTSYCTCRKLGLKCTILCKKCNGRSCANGVEAEVILSDDEEEEEFFKLTESIDDETQNDCPIITAPTNFNSDDEYEPHEKKIKKEML